MLTIGVLKMLSVLEPWRSIFRYVKRRVTNLAPPYGVKTKPWQRGEDATT